LPKVVTQRCLEQDLNPRPTDRKPKCLTVAPPRHRYISSSRGEMHIGHGRLCVCLTVPRRIPTLLHRPGCKLASGRECPLVVHHLSDLQSVHGFRYYDNIAPNAKCQRVLVLAVCLVALEARLRIKYDSILWVS